MFIVRLSLKLTLLDRLVGKDILVIFNNYIFGRTNVWSVIRELSLILAINN